MNSAMKQRMIGAMVLVAIGIIAWTLIFDPSQVYRFSQRSQIPPPPAFEKLDIAPAVRPEVLRSLDYTERNVAQLRAEQATASAAPALPESPPAGTANSADSTDEFGLPVMWAVQVGSFGQLENAQELKQRLERSGYHVIVQSVDAGPQRLSRVFIDPKLDRRHADRLRDKVDGKFGTGAMVVRYYPG